MSNICISGYTNDDRLVEGKMEGGFVLSEGRKVDFQSLKCFRFYESEEDENKDVMSKVEDDINKLDSDKLKNTTDENLEKAGEEREKELKDAGMKIEDNDYKNAFVAAAKSKGVLDDVSKGNINNSQALEKLLASQKITRNDRIREGDEELVMEYYYSQLNPDYHDVELYDDKIAAKEREEEQKDEKEKEVVMSATFTESLYKKVFEMSNTY